MPRGGKRLRGAGPSSPSAQRAEPGFGVARTTQDFAVVRRQFENHKGISDASEATPKQKHLHQTQGYNQMTILTTATTRAMMKLGISEQHSLLGRRSGLPQLPHEPQVSIPLPLFCLPESLREFWCSLLLSVKKKINPKRYFFYLGDKQQHPSRSHTCCSLLCLHGIWGIRCSTLVN